MSYMYSQMANCHVISQRQVLFMFISPSNNSNCSTNRHCWWVYIFYLLWFKIISTKLGTEHTCGKRIQVCSNEGPRPFPTGDNNKIAKTLTNFLNLLQNHWTNFNQTWHKASLSEEFCLNEEASPFPGEIIKK